MKVGFTLVLLAASGTAFLVARPHFARTPPLEWADGTGRVDLGLAEISLPQVARFALRNTSKDAVTVTHVELQCGCHGLAIEVDGSAIQAPEDGFTIPSGAEARISLGFPPRRGRHHYGVLLDDAAGNRYQAVATCQGVPDLETDPPELDLGLLSPGSAATVEFTLRSRLGVPFLLADHELHPEGRDGLIEMLDVQGAAARMRGTFVAPMETGRFGVCAELRDERGRVLRVPGFGDIDLGIEVWPGRVQVVQAYEGSARFVLSWDPDKTPVARPNGGSVRTYVAWLDARTVPGHGSCTIEATWDPQSPPTEERVAVLHVRIPELFGYEVVLALVVDRTGARR